MTSTDQARSGADDAPQEEAALAPVAPTWLTGPYGRPVHPLVASVAIGAWVCSFGFDLLSQVADTAWVYARAAHALVGAGLFLGMAAAVLGMLDLLGVPRETRAFRVGVAHLGAMNATLLLFLASFVLRATSDLAWHDGVAVVPMSLSIVGLLTLAVGVWLGGRLAYTHGVRVARYSDRLRGFEQDP